MHTHGSSNGKAKQAIGGGKAAPAKLAFRIPSSFEEAREVQRQILDAIAAHDFSEGDVFAIRLALEEAVINAIKHGNKHDASKQVWVEAQVTDDEVDITIQDQGEGFKREQVPDPTLEENLEKNSGRGILLIEAYMTGATWSDDGRRLHMHKRREPELARKN